MSEAAEIVRLAAKGDGVTADGRHFARTAPGDIVQRDGSIAAGPHHVEPVCRHFGKCGGCQLQHVDEEALLQFVTDRVLNAAEGQGLEPANVLQTYLSPPKTRRRVTLHGQKVAKGAVIGFKEAGSHRIVDIAECHVMRPELFALVAPLRDLIGLQDGKVSVDVEMVLTDQGVDCTLGGFKMEGLAATEGALDFARDNGLARLSIDQGYGAETVWEPEPVTVTYAGVPVAYPSGAFLQATGDAEAVLAGDVREWLGERGAVADLFSGLGTFAFALSDMVKVLAVEAARDAHLACKTAAALKQLQVHSLHRDLFRNPLQADELNRFAGVILDPPRAGARDQVEQLAASGVPRIAYVSCNPSSWARDAKRLVDAGYRLEALRPVGQFRWSTHVELTSLFVR